MGKLYAVKLFSSGHTTVERRDDMQLKGLAITMGLGAAAGAVAILMMPKNNPTRKLASKAALKVEDAAMQLGNKLSNEIDHM